LVCENDADEAQLQWNNGQNTRTVPISQYDNCFTFRLVPGFKYFMAYCAEFGLDNPQSLLADATLIEDDEDETSQSSAPEPWIPSVAKAKSPYSVYTPDWTCKEVDQLHVIPHESDELQNDMEANRLQLLKYHQHQFGHVSFQRLQEMAKQGVIPNRFATVAPPMCAVCSYAKATRKPWKGKNRIDYKEIKYIKPGEMVSVDQLVSPSPGFIAQKTGKLTISRYKYATVYVDHASRLGYVYLEKSADADETVKGKLAFEAYAESRGISIKAYHADNGIFRAKKSLQACEDKQQRITFTGIHAHHTNGMAEKRIRDLQDLARAMLLHASTKWNSQITANLWPYAWRMKF
jgi:hypothetical protein